MEDYVSYYQKFVRPEDIKITCYDQLTTDEISLHVIYTEFYYPKMRYMKLSTEDKYILNEAIGRYCRKYDISTDHIFDINVIGELIPKRIREGHINIDSIVNSSEGTLVEWEIKDNIKEVRCELNKRKAKNEDIIEWIGDWK